MARAVLALNAGSSSIKFTLAEIEADAAPRCVLAGQVEGIGTAPHLLARDGSGKMLRERRWSEGELASYEVILDVLMDWIENHLGADILIGVGHRVVHGGSGFTAPIRVDEAVLKRLAALSPLAPLHQPHNLAPIRAIMAVRRELPQIACFDTAFHHTQPAVATRFALPRIYAEEGVRRYGFHGLSYEYIARRLREIAPDLAEKRIIVAHLGNGASLCAMRGGRSLDTTMGFTALDGLMMGTRCGTIDAGVLLYMQQQKHLTVGEVERTLYRESGLLGVSGLSSDMRDLLSSAMPAAKEAIELFVYRIGREAAALAGSLGGLDGFVFTAGIGENAPEIRAAVCERLQWLGVRLDAPANSRGAGRISGPESGVQVHVIPTDEDATILRHVMEKLEGTNIAG